MNCHLLQVVSLLAYCVCMAQSLCLVVVTDHSFLSWIGSTALHEAAINGKAEAVAALLRCGAKPEAQTRTGVTALHLACNQDHVDCATFLLELGGTPLTAVRSEKGIWFANSRSIMSDSVWLSCLSAFAAVLYQSNSSCLANGGCYLFHL